MTAYLEIGDTVVYTDPYPQDEALGLKGARGVILGGLSPLTPTDSHYYTVKLEASGETKRAIGRRLTKVDALTPVRDELQDLKDKVYVKAMALAEEHEWCTVVGKALAELGIKKPEALKPKYGDPPPVGSVVGYRVTAGNDVYRHMQASSGAWMGTNGTEYSSYEDLVDRAFAGDPASVRVLYRHEG